MKYQMSIARTAIITAVLIYSGCVSNNGLRPRAGKSDNVQELIGSVAVRHWKEQPITFDFTESSNSLASVLGETQNLSIQATKRALRDLARQRKEIDIDTQQLDDNCIILIRGTQNYYIPRAMLSLQEISGLTVRSNDQILTAPITQTVFMGKPKLQEESTITIANLMENKISKSTVKPNTIHSILDSRSNVPNMKLFDDIDSARTNLAIVSRGNHHLFLPAASSGARGGDTTFYGALFAHVGAQLRPTRNVQGEKYQPVFQDGDVIQLTNLANVSQLF